MSATIAWQPFAAVEQDSSDLYEVANRKAQTCCLTALASMASQNAADQEWRLHFRTLTLSA
jgi:hypothetical protein